MSDALTAAPPATVRLEHVVLTSGDAAPLGPLVAVADRTGLTLWRPGDPDGRALPWHRVRRVRVEAAERGATVLVATDRGFHRLWAPDADPGATADALAAVAGSVPVTFPGASTPATAPAVEAPAAEAPTTEAGAPAAEPPGTGASTVAPAPEPARTTDTPEPAPQRTPSAAAPAWFVRARPVLTVVLVVAVATMVALVLADSTGAIHLGWLGGGGGGGIPAGH